MNKLFSISLISIIWLCSCGHENQENNISGWKLTFRNDAAGKTLVGDKQALIDAVRNGYDVRVGWGGQRASDTTKSVEHVAPAQFLTITNNHEVFAQITPIIGQRPNLNADSISINFNERTEWTTLLGTNGHADRMSTDRIESVIGGHNQRATEISWFVNYPILKSPEENPKPLYK